jgi:hypothetical protein
MTNLCYIAVSANFWLFAYDAWPEQKGALYLAVAFTLFVLWLAVT